MVSSDDDDFDPYPFSIENLRKQRQLNISIGNLKRINPESDENKQSHLNNKKTKKMDCANGTISSEAESDIICIDDDFILPNNSEPAVKKDCTNKNISVVNENEFCVASTSKDVNVPKKRRKQYDFSSTKILGPVICIGDFYDDYDISSLKNSDSKKKDNNNDEIRMLKNYDSLEDLEEVNRVVKVKVFWLKKRTHCFNIRMFQNIESIFEHFSKLESVSTSFIRLELNKKILSPLDTPKSINYRASDFIDGDIDYLVQINETKELSSDEVTFRIMQKDVKRPLLISIDKSDKMSVLYVKLSEKLNLSFNLFTLEFDGEKIQTSDTMESLDLEGGECIELFRKNV